MNFPNILRSLRLQIGLNQTDFAKAIGVSRSTIGMYETGKREPDFETLELIADYFNVSLDYLMGNSIIKNIKPTPEGELQEDLLVLHRNGERIEYHLTEDQLKAIKPLLDQLNSQKGPDI